MFVEYRRAFDTGALQTWLDTRSKIPGTEWQEIVQEFVDHVKSRDTLQGFLQCLSRVGDDLEVAVPKTSDNKNEPDDRLILIGYD